MTKIMKGFRIVEVAQYTFVPAAGAILADWGADVIKIEHPVRGDTQRGFRKTGGIDVNPNRHTLIEHPNRGKRSVGLDVSKPEGQALLYEIAKTADVFLTNALPSMRQKNKIDIEHIRAVNPNIIYARGSGYGDKGPERDAGGFDNTAFWTRTGIGLAMTPPELDGMLMQGMPAFGDSIGGMNIAGGVAGALLHRLRTGEAVEVDVSLMSSGWWAAGAGIAQALDLNIVGRNRMPKIGGSPHNPFTGAFRTSDGQTIVMTTNTPGRYIRDIFEHLDLPEAADDPRFSTVDALLANWADASALMVQAFGKQPMAYWRNHLKTMRAQWAPCQSLVDLGGDEQALANDMIIEVEAGDGGRPIKLVRGPVQFNHEAVETHRAPLAGEHTETFLLEDVGLSWEQIEKLKAAGVIN